MFFPQSSILVENSWSTAVTRRRRRCRRRSSVLVMVAMVDVAMGVPPMNLHLIMLNAGQHTRRRGPLIIILLAAAAAATAPAS